MLDFSFQTSAHARALGLGPGEDISALPEAGPPGSTLFWCQSGQRFTLVLTSAGAWNLCRISTTLSNPMAAFIFFPPNQPCANTVTETFTRGSLEMVLKLWHQHFHKFVFILPQTNERSGNCKWAGIAQLVEHPTGTSGAILMQIWVPSAARDFSSQSTPSPDSLTVSVQPLCATTCINICAHLKNPKRWRLCHCLDTRKYCTHW